MDDNPNRPGVLVFRCRRCNALERIERVYNMEMALGSAVVEQPIPKTHGSKTYYRIYITDIHDCEDGGLGIMDLIGADPEGGSNAQGV